MGFGILFNCFNADISRQFEFIQNVWVNNAAFGDLYNEVDPIIGTRQNSAGSYQYDFTCPGKYIRRKYKDIPQFVQVLGGAYFFMPGIRALKFIVSF